MSVNAQHSQYCKMLPKWKRCRDAAKGQDAVHFAAEDYLPKLKSEDDSDYKARVLRATFYNATWRTIAGMQGMMFRKEPVVVVPATIEEMLDDITLDGVPMHMFALQVVEECLEVGRLGVLVDFPQVLENYPMTQADAGPMNLRPSLCLYKAESIINWKTKRINNKTMVSMVVTTEECCEPIDEFEDNKPETHYRVFDLDPASGYYRQRLFYINDKGEDVQIGTDIFPMMNGVNMTEIPFIFIGVDDITCDCDEPPLIDLVDMNLAHYRVTADYEHGCHITGLPTPWITGHVKDDADKLYIGSQTAWVFPSADTKCGFLEFTGQGLDALVVNLNGKEKMMATLGARLLEDRGRAVESAEALSLRHAGENSILASMAQAVSIGLEKALQTLSDWAGGSGEVEFDLNRDFLPEPMDYNMVLTLFKLMQGGGMSFESLFYNLQRGDLFPADLTFEDEQTKIKATTPMLMGAQLPLPGVAQPVAPASPGKKQMTAPKGQSASGNMSGNMSEGE